MYVGQTVHIYWRGRCHAAIITDLWDVENAARLTVFENGGPVVHSRVVLGDKWDEDRTFHLIDECPSVSPVGSKSMRAAEPAEAVGRRQ